MIDSRSKRCLYLRLYRIIRDYIAVSKCKSHCAGLFQRREHVLVQDQRRQHRRLAVQGPHGERHGASDGRLAGRRPPERRPFSLEIDLFSFYFATVGYFVSLTVIDARLHRNGVKMVRFKSLESHRKGLEKHENI